MRARRKVTGGLKLFHDKYGKAYDEYRAYVAQFDEAGRQNEALRACLSKVSSYPFHVPPA
jgi:hypothetical protein